MWSVNGYSCSALQCLLTIHPLLITSQAAVLAGFPENLHAVLCLAENSVDSRSTRPDDVITLYSGKTVEVNNTDAEGRLVLGDGTAYACKHLGPDIIIDLATLTGAQSYATGLRHAGVLANTAALEAFLVAAGKRSGDLCFPLLYCPELLGVAPMFPSEVADMKNSTRDRSNAPSSGAGHFIEEHLCSSGSKPAWAHIDIAA